VGVVCGGVWFFSGGVQEKLEPHLGCGELGKSSVESNRRAIHVGFPEEIQRFKYLDVLFPEEIKQFHRKSYADNARDRMFYCVLSIRRKIREIFR
jgi:hypothetical protein